MRVPCPDDNELCVLSPCSPTARKKKMQVIPTVSRSKTAGLSARPAVQSVHAPNVRPAPACSHSVPIKPYYYVRPSGYASLGEYNGSAARITRSRASSACECEESRSKVIARPIHSTARADRRLPFRMIGPASSTSAVTAAQHPGLVMHSSNAHVTKRGSRAVVCSGTQSFAIGLSLLSSSAGDVSSVVGRYRCSLGCGH